MTLAPPPPSRIRRPGRAPLWAAAGVGASCVALAAWNPGDDGTPLCPTRALFEVDCPLCGGLRAIGSLGRFDLAAAADHNVVVVALVPVLAVWWLAWWRADRRGSAPPAVRVPPWAAVALVALVVAFAVVRNLGGGGLIGWLGSDLSG